MLHPNGWNNTSAADFGIKIHNSCNCRNKKSLQKVMVQVEEKKLHPDLHSALKGFMFHSSPHFASVNMILQSPAAFVYVPALFFLSLLVLQFSVRRGSRADVEVLGTTDCASARTQTNFVFRWSQSLNFPGCISVPSSGWGTDVVRLQLKSPRQPPLHTQEEPYTLEECMNVH